MSNVKIAQNLRRLRQSKGLTQEELAERLGITGQAVSKWEREEYLRENLPGILTAVCALLESDFMTDDEKIRSIIIGEKKRLGIAEAAQKIVEILGE